MTQNVVSFDDYSGRRRAKIKEKAMYEINGEELAEYYEKTMDEHLGHLTFLQRFIVEEFFYEVMVNVFILGTEASRPVNMGKRKDSIIHAYMENIQSIIHSGFEKHKLFQYINMMDGESISILVQQVADQWFAKGLQYGEKQRKLRLI